MIYPILVGRGPGGPRFCSLLNDRRCPAPILFLVKPQVLLNNIKRHALFTLIRYLLFRFNFFFLKNIDMSFIFKINYYT